MELKAVGIVWNSTKREGIKCAERIRSICDRKGIAVYADKELSETISCAPLAEDGSTDVDIIAVLGGDGTILAALNYALQRDIPILGINLGRVGFLAEAEADDIQEKIDRLEKDEFFIEERMLLTVEGMKGSYALNDVVVARRNAVAGVLSVEMTDNDTLIDRVSGDGIIISTPTGSTAYSLSAGGPVVAPTLDCLLITPICPHTLNARCVVTGADDVIRLRVLNRSGDACVVFDGWRKFNIDEAVSEITVRKSERRARFVRFAQRNYFELLHQKLSDWTH